MSSTEFLWGVRGHLEIQMKILENYIEKDFEVLVIWTGLNTFMIESNIEHTRML
jgi:hypothetical protein